MKFDLRIFRKQKGLTQKQVAEFLGIGQSFVSQMERGKDATPKETIAKLIDKIRYGRFFCNDANCMGGGYLVNYIILQIMEDDK